FICRPYRYNETVLTILHALANFSIVANPIATVYLWWAERYHEGIEQGARKSMVTFFLLITLYELVKVGTKWIVEIYAGDMFYVKKYLHVDEALQSLQLCFVLLFLLFSFAEFRQELRVWCTFSRRQKFDVTTNIAVQSTRICI
ncbi:hypothetical protein PENTCL1PPCAC_29932, partial [Pristionchus entomophagus]